MLAGAEDEEMEECNATASPNKSATETGDSDAKLNYSLSDDSASDTKHNKNSPFDKNTVWHRMNHKIFHVCLTAISLFDFNRVSFYKN
jgi:hypothetical protein